MKRLLLLLFLSFFGSVSFAQRHVFVNAYQRSDGTAVPAHYRTNADNTVNNNFTTVGNINPYTGKVGTLPRDDGYSYVPVQNTSYVAPTNNKPTYTVNVTTALSGGYHVPKIVEQVLENHTWRTVKEETSNAYLFFNKNLVYFKRGQNSWLVRDQIFIEYNSEKKVYIYNSNQGLSLVDENLRFILFYDANNSTKRYLYVIGNSASSIKPFQQ